MRIAIPVAGGVLTGHFGHSREYALIDADPATRQVTGMEYREPPPHIPGVLPQWLADQGVNVVIAGGMGQRALAHFEALKIAVIVGAPAEPPMRLVEKFLAGELEPGVNLCEH